MRALFAIAIFALGAVGLGEADAADMRVGVGRSTYVTHSTAIGVRASQLLIYDNEPGVHVRTYWATPWRNRHYYPFTGKRPKVGRHERLSAVRPAPKPAQSYYREWSTIALYPPVQRPLISSAPIERFVPSK